MCERTEHKIFDICFFPFLTKKTTDFWCSAMLLSCITCLVCVYVFSWLQSCLVDLLTLILIESSRM